MLWNMEKIKFVFESKIIKTVIRTGPGIQDRLSSVAVYRNTQGLTGESSRGLNRFGEEDLRLQEGTGLSFRQGQLQQDQPGERYNKTYPTG